MRIVAVVLLALACLGERSAAQTAGPSLRVVNAGSFDVRVYDGARMVASLSSGESRTVRLDPSETDRVFEVRSNLGPELRSPPQRMERGSAWELNISPAGIVAVYQRRT